MTTQKTQSVITATDERTLDKGEANAISVAVEIESIDVHGEMEKEKEAQQVQGEQKNTMSIEKEQDGSNEPVEEESKNIPGSTLDTTSTEERSRTQGDKERGKEPEQNTNKTVTRENYPSEESRQQCMEEAESTTARTGRKQRKKKQDGISNRRKSRSPIVLRATTNPVVEGVVRNIKTTQNIIPGRNEYKVNKKNEDQRVQDTTDSEQGET